MTERSGRVEFFESDGVRIISIDLSGEDGREILDTLGEAAELIQAEEQGSVRVLTDLRTTHVGLVDPSGSYDRGLVDGIKSYVKYNNPHVLATAILVGNDETAKVFLKFLEGSTGRHFEVFEERESAIDYLTRTSE